MATCMYPYMVERKLYHNQKDKNVPVPCGKCPNCLKRRLASWSFRLETEALRWERQHFITLTYDNEHVPISPNSFLTLNKKHTQDFFKRLRKRSGKLRYYLCGEYGTNTKRPHYHAILFGNTNLEENDIIQAWSQGDVYFGKVEAASIRYTVQYFDKGQWLRAHARDDREPEFSTMSQGIGSNFLTPRMVKHFLNNPQLSYIYDKEGRKIAIPSYYKKRLYDYLGNDLTILTHPSLLIHRDEMLQAKEKHHKSIAEIMETITVVEEDTKERNENRRMAIENYRQSKRKSRK